MNRTMYIYDEVTGHVGYTIDDVNNSQIENFKKKNIPFYVSHPRHRIIGTYVKKDSEGMPVGITPVQHMDFISLNKGTMVANGTDEVVISGLSNGMFVDVNGEFSYTCNTAEGESGSTLEISANGFSHTSEHNQMVIKFVKYGYHDSAIKIGLLEGE